jgi:hypothetical protein
MASTSATDFPGFDRLYHWSSALERSRMRATFVHPDGSLVMHDDPVLRSTTATLIWRPSGGSVPSNILWTSSAAVVLVTRRIADVLTGGHVTGWLSQPTASTESAFAGQYVGVRVSGRCGRLDYSRGTWVREEIVLGRWRRSLRGLYFDEQSWDGSDVFSPEGMNKRIVTERTHEILRLAGIENSRLLRLTECLTSETVIEAFAKVDQGSTSGGSVEPPPEGA